ncbi:signal recognition particle protein [bacterium]|nr:MAG: signal recognition particle protein [bacterium]
MLDSLTRRLAGIMGDLRKKGRLSEDDVNEMLREVRVALLEADVNFGVAKDFIKRVKEKAVGENVFGSLTADQTVVKIVRDELVDILGNEPMRFNYGSQPPTIVLMCGLQGSGKTTTTAKLAKWLVKEGKKPMLAACDIQRPAAIKQLEVLGETVGVPVYAKTDGTSPVTIAREALERAKYLMCDVLIVDTAGRLSIDEALMGELKQIHDTVRPTEVFLVLDSTTGQEAVNVAKAFHERVPVTGAIFTKLDGDTRGGAILSVRAATGVPVRFTGVGEAVDALEPFFPERMAERIIGMGDVMSLIEKAETAFAGEDIMGMQSSLMGGQMDFNMMLEMFRLMKKMGPLKGLLKMIPGMAALPEEAMEAVGNADTKHIEAIIYSMTPKERTNPDIINGSRRKRIAAGSGRTVEEVNQLLRQFTQSRRQMKQLGKMQDRMSSKHPKFRKR